MNPRVLLTVLCVFVLPLLPACDMKHAQDRTDIHQAWANFIAGIEARNGDGVIKTLSKPSIERYDRLLKLAMDGTRQQVRELGPLDKLDLVTMRVKCRKSELKKLDGARYVALAISKGWWGSRGEEANDLLRRYQFGKAGDTASAEIAFNGESSGMRVSFAREDGVWKYDEAASARAWNEAFRAEADEIGLTVDNYVIMSVEETIEGVDVPQTIWDPMK